MRSVFAYNAKDVKADPFSIGKALVGGLAQQMTPELAQLYDEQKIVLTKRSIGQRRRNQLERQAAQ